MTFEEFKNLASAIQSIIVSLGFLSGGIWALFRFRAFRETEKARVELDKLQREIKERGVLKISLNPSILNSGNNKHIKLDILVENTGNRSEVLNWKKASVKLARCIWNDDGSRQYCDWQSLVCEYSWGYVNDSIVHPGEVCGFGYISEKISDGIYYIEAVVPGTPATEKEYALEGGRTDYKIAWSVNTYISVDRNGQQENPANSKTGR